MNCLLITSIFSPINGGSAVVYENLCLNLKNDYLMTVLSAKFNCNTGDEIEGWHAHDEMAKYPIYRLNYLRPKIINSQSIFHSLFLLLFVDLPLKIKVFFKVMHIIKKNNIKIICIGDLNSLSWIGKWIKIFYKIKIINYIHGEEVTTEANYSRFKNARANHLKSADAIIAVSTFTRDYLINRFRLDPNKIIIIPNGVNNLKFSSAKKEENRKLLRQRYNLSGKKVFVTVGRLVFRKGIDTVLYSLPKVLDKYPDAHYVIVGSGPIRKQLEGIIDKLQISSAVTFAGNIDDNELIAHYHMADVFIMPNRTMPDGDTEGFGLVFLEANACEIPVIAGRAGGASDAVINNLNGLSVDGLDGKEVSSAMINLLDNPQLAKNLVMQGKEYIKDKSFAACALQFEKLCRDLLRS